ncbi:hypothetical protein N0V94_005620 [Neodidymelliopsis sp. IMI 364377]|nr:hypothetical protein N0V94_005620 [Neodidymelliopsis sp. IMI 364377]
MRNSRVAHFGPDIIQIVSIDSSGIPQELRCTDFTSMGAYNFLVKSLIEAASVGEWSSRAIKVVIPQSTGYILRSDILPLRFLHCNSVDFVESFCEPLQFFPGTKSTRGLPERLPEIFNLSIGGIYVHPSHRTGEAIELDLQFLEIELVNRLSFPWLVSEKRSRKTVALVEGRYNLAYGESTYLAAKALGIDIVVLDKAGHWVQSEEHRAWRKDFLPVVLKNDDNLPDVIVDALEKYGQPIDGIATFWDQGMVGTAKAAVRLGLPTNDPVAVEAATDKYKTSQFEGHPSCRASSLAEALTLIRRFKLQYPLIVKPCSGWLSQGVHKVQSDSDLATALNSIDTEKHGKDFVLEKYCDGPELDVNFILSDGELLFFEGSDEFPKSGDTASATALSSFMEFGNLYPSSLPQKEIAMLRRALTKTLTRMGLNDGMFHLEARIQDSTMEFGIKDGVPDLVPRQSPPSSDPSAWLIEINTRPPGIGEVDIVAMSYGVDFWGVTMCNAIRDRERMAALSQPFATGPQYWVEMVMLPIERGGIFASDDICDELLQRRPDLAKHVGKSHCFWKRGDRLPDPSSGSNMWVCQYLVFSRESRHHVLTVGEQLRQETKWALL